MDAAPALHAGRIAIHTPAVAATDNGRNGAAASGAEAREEHRQGLGRTVLQYPSRFPFSFL